MLASAVAERMAAYSSLVIRLLAAAARSGDLFWGACSVLVCRLQAPVRGFVIHTCLNVEIG